MPQFQSARLDLARRRRGLTKTKLAELLGVGTRALSFYLSGDREPGADAIDRMGSVLDFPPAFFLGPEMDEPPLDGVSFRSLSSMTARQRDQAVGSAAIALQLDDWIAERFDLPQPDVPRLRRESPESASEAIREAWGLGQRRAPNMIHLLEKHGVRVFSLAEDNTAVDAFSFWRGDTPYVFLNTTKTAQHSRMDAAHELGHLVLHAWGGPSGRGAEEEAKAFGSAFLLPRGSVIAGAPRSANVQQIIRAKHHWNVSAMALAYRMSKLGLLSEWQARTVFSQLGQLGYRKGEPDTERQPRETSQVLAKVFGALRAEGMSRSSIAEQLLVGPRELNTVIFGLVLSSIDGEKAQADRSPRQGELRLLKGT